MPKLSRWALALALASVGCSSQVDVEQVPVGTEIELTRQDGGVVRGALEARDEQTVRVKAGRVSRSVPREEIAVVQVVDEAKPAPLPPIAKFREYNVAAGTKLAVRLESTAASDVSRVEEPVEGTLTEAVVVDGTTVIPAGSRVLGEVASAQPSGKVKGRASLALRFHTVVVGDERYPIAARVSAIAPATKGEDAAKIGVPAAGGAIVGGIIGGRRGAAIGGAIGGGAGTAVVLSTAGDEVRFERGSVITLPIEHAVDIRVPLDRT